MGARKLFARMSAPAPRNRPGVSAIVSVMKTPKKLIKDIEVQIKVGKALVKEKKRKVKEAASKLERENAKLALQTVKKAVESIEEHAELVTSTLKPEHKKEPAHGGKAA